MRISYHPKVRHELRQAIFWYERQQPGLGGEFRDAYKAALEGIVDHPDAYPTTYSDCRLAGLKTFPYGIVFRVDDQTISIDCIRHHSRHPRFGFGRK